MIKESNNFTRTKNLSSQSVREYVPKGYSIEIVVKTDASIYVKKDAKKKCGSLVHNKDSCCILLVKIICILPFLPVVIIWKLLKCLAYSLKTFYLKYLRRWITYIKLTTYIGVVIMIQQILILCLKFTKCLQQGCYSIFSIFKNFYRLIGKCCYFIGSQIFDCLTSCGNSGIGCYVFFCEKIAQLVLCICKYPGKFLYWYINLALRVLLKSVEIRMAILHTIQLISVSFSLFIIAPILYFIMNRILNPIFNKINEITYLSLNIIYIFTIKQFYELYILKIFKLLKYLILEVLINTIIKKFIKGIYQLFIFIYRKFILNIYSYFFVKFLYRGIIVNTFKLIKFIFYTILYLKILINILKLIKWILQKLMLFIKYFCQGCKKFTVMILTLFTKFLKGIFSIFKFIINYFIIKPIWWICKVIIKIFQIIKEFSYRYFLLPIWNFMKKSSVFVEKFMLKLWNSIKSYFFNQKNSENNS